jgi:hypothetical protein
VPGLHEERADDGQDAAGQGAEPSVHEGRRGRRDAGENECDDADQAQGPSDLVDGLLSFTANCSVPAATPASRPSDV